MDMTLTRGLRNHSPGNLRHSTAFTWLGEIAPDADGYCRFDTDDHGLRAIALDVWTKWQRDKLRTVRAIITRYAPPIENPTANYIANVCAALGGIKPDDPVDLSDPAAETMFVKAIIRQECGSVPYMLTQILAAVRAARGTVHPDGATA